MVAFCAALTLVSCDKDKGKTKDPLNATTWTAYDGDNLLVLKFDLGTRATFYVGDKNLERIGPDFEHHPAFPDRINTEFIQVEDAHTLRMRVWERGSGETLACGTGACASAVAAILTGRVSADGPVLVKLLGGDLHIEWNRQVNTVYMTGPATEVFHGEIDL